MDLPRSGRRASLAGGDKPRPYEAGSIPSPDLNPLPNIV